MNMQEAQEELAQLRKDAERYRSALVRIAGYKPLRMWRNGVEITPAIRAGTREHAIICIAKRAIDAAMEKTPCLP